MWLTPTCYRKSPWTIYGEGPTTAAAGAFAEKTSYTPRDIRFTTKRDMLYAITLGMPQGQTVITSPAQANPHERRRVRSVRLLGRPGGLAFRQTGQALVIDLPTRHASAFAIEFA